jgi:dTDP-4-amino-4,6-dideoxygalactose transaminase
MGLVFGAFVSFVASVMKVPFLDLSLQHKAIRDEALAALTATYDANRFCLGKDVEDFEKAFARTLGFPRALALNSGTSPLHIAAMIAGWGPGDEVIAPPFTFISTVWGVSYVGASPRFVDVEEGTFNLDPAKVEAAITPKTKGIIAVHLFGQPAGGRREFQGPARRYLWRRRYVQLLPHQKPRRVWRGGRAGREG